MFNSNQFEEEPQQTSCVASSAVANGPQFDAKLAACNINVREREFCKKFIDLPREDDARLGRSIISPDRNHCSTLFGRGKTARRVKKGGWSVSAAPHTLVI